MCTGFLSQERAGLGVLFARSWLFRSFRSFGFQNILSGFRVGLSVLNLIAKGSLLSLDTMFKVSIDLGLWNMVIMVKLSLAIG